MPHNSYLPLYIDKQLMTLQLSLSGSCGSMVICYTVSRKAQNYDTTDKIYAYF